MSLHSSMGSAGDSRKPSFRLGDGIFPLEAREIRIGDLAVPLLEVPYTQANLDAVAGLRAPSALRERDWPYWLEDWPATYALAEALSGEAGTLAGPVLDLGCGSGFMAAFFRSHPALRGLPVFSCDFNRDACRLAALNALGSDGGKPARTFCADFHHFPSSARFGTLLAGEMLYARENQAPILAFLESHLAPGGSAWLADPGRSAAEGFRIQAAAAGFRVEVNRIASRAAGRNVDVYKLAKLRA